MIRHKKNMTRHTKDFAEVIRHKLLKDADLAQGVEADRFNINVSGEVYRVRSQCGLTQKQLADRMGTRQSVVARLEDAEYDGHPLKLLRRIAEATGKRLEVRFIDSSVSGKVAKKSPAKRPASVKRRSALKRAAKVKGETKP